jgi:hypothetical protein
VKDHTVVVPDLRGMGLSVQGREHIYLDRFYNELSADQKPSIQKHDHYAALYAKPHAMHDA